MPVLRIIDLRGTDPAALPGGKLAGVLPRAAVDVEKATEAVRPVCEDVRQRGAAAVREYTARFDGVDLATTRVPAAALADAGRALDPAVRAALQEAARRARLVHEAQLPVEPVTELAPGSTVTERYVPVRRAGVYVPGGLVAYPSSVVMNVIPAQVAGVDEIAVASPPSAAHGGGAALPDVLAHRPDRFGGLFHVDRGPRQHAGQLPAGQAGRIRPAQVDDSQHRPSLTARRMGIPRPTSHSCLS